MQIYTPINRIYIPDKSISRYINRLKFRYGKNYKREEHPVDAIYFNRRESDGSPIKAFQSDFFEILSEYHPLENIILLDFYCIEFDGNLSEDFFQPIKDSLRVIKFNNCRLNYLPEGIFRNLDLDELYLGLNAITDFNTPLDCRGLKRVESYNFTFNVETIFFDNPADSVESYTLPKPGIDDEYYLFDLDQRLDIKNLHLAWNKPSLDRDANFDELVDIYIGPNYEDED